MKKIPSFFAAALWAGAAVAGPASPPVAVGIDEAGVRVQVGDGLRTFAGPSVTVAAPASPQNPKQNPAAVAAALAEAESEIVVADIDGTGIQVVDRAGNRHRLPLADYGKRYFLEDRLGVVALLENRKTPKQLPEPVCLEKRHLQLLAKFLAQTAGSRSPKDGLPFWVTLKCDAPSDTSDKWSDK